MTAAWVAQAASRPKMITVAVGKNHYTAGMIDKTGRFSVNVLKSGQEELAKQCGYKSGRNVDKSENIDYEMKDGLPAVTIPNINPMAGSSARDWDKA